MNALLDFIYRRVKENEIKKKEAKEKGVKADCKRKAGYFKIIYRF